jgi:hypothetical protein
MLLGWEKREDTGGIEYFVDWRTGESHWLHPSESEGTDHVLDIIGSLLGLAFSPIHSWLIAAYKNTFSVILMHIGSISSTIAHQSFYYHLHLEQ